MTQQAEFLLHRPPRRWQRITIIIAPVMTDTVAAFLADHTGTGVEISSPPAGVRDSRERVIGYLSAGELESEAEESLVDIEEFITLLAQNYPAYPLPVVETDIILEEDWNRNWKRHFTVLSITPRIVIKPTWESCTIEDGSGGPQKVVIEMDPGLAFGTGHHASTQLALQLIDEMFSPGAIPGKVLDIGTGTGILAMACALLGSRAVTAVDIDPDAVVAAQENVRHNNLDKIVTVSNTDIASLKGSYDLIVANIVHDVLQEMAPDIIRLLVSGGRLIMAGILKNEQEKSIINTYAGLGCTHLQTHCEDEWVAILFGKETI